MSRFKRMFQRMFQRLFAIDADWRHEWDHDLGLFRYSAAPTSKPRPPRQCGPNPPGTKIARMAEGHRLGMPNP